MKIATFARIFGWLQLVLVAAGQVFAKGTVPTPHTWQDWFHLIASLLTALAVHHAAGTEGTR